MDDDDLIGFLNSGVDLKKKKDKPLDAHKKNSQLSISSNGEEPQQNDKEDLDELGDFGAVYEKRMQKVEKKNEEREQI